MTIRRAGVNAGLNALGVRLDAAPSYKYYVEIEGLLVAEFTECTGLSVERQVKTYEEGGVNDFVHVLPGRVKYANLVLKRGITYSREMWKWFQFGIYDGLVKRVNMSIILGDASGLKAKHWNVLSAFPVKYTGPDLKADSAEAAIETVEIAHHGLELSLEVMTPMRLI
jgi:phage tail-like protein